MKLYLYGHEYKYAVEQMLLTLYPSERPQYPEGEPEGKRMEIRLSRGEKRITASCRLFTASGRFDGRAAAEAMLLSIGIAVQNVPEGTVISLPLFRDGMQKPKAILYGVLSGAVEPAAALMTYALSRQIVPLLPWCLSFAAGAMLFVVAKDLMPEKTDGQDLHGASLLFCLGFTVMMSLDAAFA